MMTKRHGDDDDDPKQQHASDHGESDEFGIELKPLVVRQETTNGDHPTSSHTTVATGPLRIGPCFTGVGGKRNVLTLLALTAFLLLLRELLETRRENKGAPPPTKSIGRPGPISSTVLGSCVWSPLEEGSSYQETPCMHVLSRRILTLADADVPPHSWLFFGDSTMYRMYEKSPLQLELFSKAREIQKTCPRSSLECQDHFHDRCGLMASYGLETVDKWKPPNYTLGEGPVRNGLENPGCTDCAGCNSDYSVCQSIERNNKNHYCDVSSRVEPCSRLLCLGNFPRLVRAALARLWPPESKKPLIYGGFIASEFARDVELQTPQYGTTQENAAVFLEQHYNSDPWLVDSFGGPPVCVVVTGIHDMKVPNITLSTFLTNVDWYLELLLGNCQHVIWLQNTASNTTNEKDPKYKPEMPQTQERIREWNQGVHQHLLNSTLHRLPLQRLSILDAFEASIDYPHDDNIHLTDPWYQSLGSFFVQLARQVATSGTP